MPGRECLFGYERRAREASDRENERRLDRIRFTWFCIGVAFALVAVAVVELAARQTGT